MNKQLIRALNLKKNTGVFWGGVFQLGPRYLYVRKKNLMSDNCLLLQAKFCSVQVFIGEVPLILIRPNNLPQQSDIKELLALIYFHERCG